MPDFTFLIFAFVQTTFVGWFGLRLWRKRQKNRLDKNVLALCILTISLIWIVMLPLTFNPTFWDTFLPEHGEFAILFGLILYFSFVSAAAGVVLFGLVMTGDIHELPILHIKAPPKLKSKLNFKDHLLTEIFRFFGRSILYAGLLFLLTVAFLPAIIACDNVNSGFCRYFNPVSGQIGNTLIKSLNPTPIAFVFLFIGAVIAFITDRFKQT